MSVLPLATLPFVVPCLLLLSSCSSPPKPPTVDESLKRPANTAMAVELQVCRNDLHNTRILASESGRQVESTTTMLERLAARQQAFAAAQGTAASSASSSAANVLFTVRFEFGSARVVVPTDVASALIEEARSAPLVLLRGRTDGTSDSLAEGRIARERATAVRDYLVGAGVDPAHIRTTYQPIGDFVADNSGTTGRALNRRVEIELYRALPVAMTSLATTLP